MANPERATRALSKSHLRYEGLVITGDFQQVEVASLNVECIQAALLRPTTIGEELTSTLVMWHDLSAVLEDVPMMNHWAMSLMTRFLGPVGTRIIWGNVMFTGRRNDGGPRPLNESEIRDLRAAENSVPLPAAA